MRLGNFLDGVRKEWEEKRISGGFKFERGRIGMLIGVDRGGMNFVFIY